jgi:hypothetical protein
MKGKYEVIKYKKNTTRMQTDKQKKIPFTNAPKTQLVSHLHKGK